MIPPCRNGGWPWRPGGFPRGFSLVELLVAMLVLALLLAGLGRIHGAGLRGCRRLQDGLRAQRTLRMAMAGLNRDLRMLGYFYPPPEWRRLAWPEGPAFQAPFQWVPAQPIPRLEAGSFQPRRPADDPWEPETTRADELSFVQDLPLEVEAVLGAGCPEGAWEDGRAPELSLRVDRAVTLRPGDLLVLEDGRFEWAALAAPVKLAPGAAVAVALVPPGLAAAHAAGARVALVRPLQVVRYAVVYLALDGAAALTPCLVRFETPFGADGQVPAWAKLLARPATLPGRARVVAEQVCGFRVAFPLGKPFPRQGEEEPAGDPARQAPGPAAPAEPAYGGAGSLGFRRTPRLLQVTLEVRSSAPRSEYAAAGAAAGYLRRSLTWVVAPGHAGLDPPPRLDPPP